ncbi:MAG: hypothetical protein ACT4OE_02755 [Sphingosinicella sp.]
MGRLERWLIAATVAGLAAAAIATETQNYSYDARGRLVKITRSGTVNANVNSAYSHDKADNRTNKTVTGASK